MGPTHPPDEWINSLSINFPFVLIVFTRTLVARVTTRFQGTTICYDWLPPHCQVSQTSVKLHGFCWTSFLFPPSPFAISLTTPPPFTLFTSFLRFWISWFLSLSLCLSLASHLFPLADPVSFSAFVESLFSQSIV